MKFFVIAGNHEQARRWIKDECSRRFASGDTSASLSDYIYVDDVSRIKGYTNPHGKFIGTWRERWDIREIILQLCVSTMPPNPVLQKMLAELPEPVGVVAQEVAAVVPEAIAPQYLPWKI